MYHRRSGRDCRNPGHRDVNGCELRNSLYKLVPYLRYCHPWLLDPGNPCRDDMLYRYLCAQKIGAGNNLLKPHF